MGMVIDDLRVQAMVRAGGGRSYTIVWPDGTLHEEADGFLRLSDGTGTQKTYAYYLVDHLRWRERERLSTESMTLRDLHRYMGAAGARVPIPYGQRPPSPRPGRATPGRPRRTGRRRTSERIAMHPDTPVCAAADRPAWPGRHPLSRDCTRGRRPGPGCPPKFWLYGPPRIRRRLDPALR